MSIYDKLGAKTASIKARETERPAEKPLKTAPTMFLDSTKRMHAAEEKVELLEARLLEAEAKTINLEIPLDHLHEVPGRRRKLTAEEYTELRENLRNNDIVTPITVRKREQGEYEIISGHNRVAIFRELGRATIPSVVRDTDKAQADINAFYANLLQTSLPDYEKYLGFCMIQARLPNLSHQQIADMAGISRSHITKLMAFSNLPPAAHKILQEHVTAVGATAAQDFAGLIKQGRTEQVVEAINKIAAGELDQTQAVKFASATKNSTPTNKFEPIKIKSGKATYCNLKRADKIIRLEFSSADDAEAVQDAIYQILETRAKQKKLLK